MPISIIKGEYLVIDWTDDFIAFDGSPDNASVGTLSNTNGVQTLAEKAAGSERKFYLSVRDATTTDGSATLTLAVTLPGQGGAGQVTKSSPGPLVSFSVPVDHRGANPPNISGPFAMPHPA